MWSPIGSISSLVRYFALAAAFSLPVSDGLAEPVRVYVGTSSDDPVGRLVGFEVREAIRRSAGLTLSSEKPESDWFLHLITMNPDEQRAGNQTIYSVAITVVVSRSPFIEMYVAGKVGLCGRERVEACARDLVALVDEQASSVSRAKQRVKE